MSVDKFGRYEHHRASIGLRRGPRGEGFKLTESGDYDMDHRRLRNVSDVDLSDGDAVSFRLLNYKAQQLIEEMKSCDEKLKTYFDEVRRKTETDFKSFIISEDSRVKLGCIEEQLKLLSKIENYKKDMIRRILETQMDLKAYTATKIQEAESSFNNQLNHFTKKFESDILNIMNKLMNKVNNISELNKPVQSISKSDDEKTS